MSWAEDNGYDAYDEESVAGFYSDTKEYEWEDKAHDIKLISDLTTPHIEFILKGFESGKDYWQQTWKKSYLEKELKKRES